MLDLVTKRRETVKGGELLARMLKAEGVETVFGIIDGTYHGFYTSLRGLGIRLITPRHESSAVHMAAAHARLTGKLGVCMASNGPGVANVLPGIACEQAEGNRVLLVTSARREGTIDPDRGGTYQSFPQVEVTAPMTKWSVRVPEAERLPEIARRALRMSWKGRPGVVHIDIPESIVNGTMEIEPDTIRPPQSYRNVEPIHPASALVERAAEILIEANLPIIHAGSGVVHARAFRELARVAELLHAPVTTSWAGRAAVSEVFSYAIPMHAVDLVTRVRNEADAVLILGSRVGETDWWGKPPYWRAPSEQKTIQVDIDEETIGLNKPCDLAILADVRVFLEKLHEALFARKSRIDVAARRARLAAYQEERGRERARLDEKHLSDLALPMNPAHVAATCRRLFSDDAVCVLDGGNAAVWGHFFHEVRAPGALLSTFKMGMLGAGVPQAIGAKAAFFDREVYLITGDGAFGFCPQEIETAVRHGLKIVVLIVCDGQWGMVKMNQQFMLRPLKTLLLGSLGPEETINTDFAPVRWDELARALGAHGERVASPKALEEAIRRCREIERPCVIQVDVDPVKHMWAPGLKKFKDMHCEPKG
jgi:acetolactate synthase-1/2/3 large subunit